MRLKALEINGFKSFADKTKIDFHEGVTAIVGPNGCGKSNVVDAVRWALGETSAKALRGGEMADVIFNGSDKRKPMGMAEVSLTFSDCENLGLEFNEVCVSRRVFRDGRSEYELNGNGCRLKDILKLFMDTGVGRSAYSIMEQGKIDLLLSAKPEDRRMVFEEAAGITKSKAEKKEALRKLEYTEANLLRVTDILTELKRQMGSTQRQATKARRYQELHKDVVILDTHLSHKRHTDLSVERAELDNSVQSLRLRQDEMSARIEDEESAIAQARMELSEMDHQISSLRHQLNERHNHIHAATSRISFNGERTRELETLIQQNQAEATHNEDRLAHQEEELKNANEALSAISENILRQRSQIEEHARMSHGVREERARLDRSLRESRQAIHTAEGIIISAQAEMQSHQAQSETDRQRQEQLQRDLASLDHERDTKKSEEGEMSARLADLKEEMEELEIALHTRERELQEALSEFEIIHRKQREVHRLYSEKQSRAQVLRQFIAQGEGLEKGTQEVLRGLDDPDLFSGGTRGLLSTYLEVDREFIPAVESALGHHLHGVLVASNTLATAMIDTLTRAKSGEAIIIPEDWLQASVATQMQTLPEGATAWALDKVKINDPVKPLLHHLLGNVLIVPDLATAVQLKQQFPDIALATLAGEFISAEGTIRGGQSADSGGSILQRQAELRDLEMEEARLEEELTSLEGQIEALQNRQRQLKTAVEEQREMLQVRRVNESTLLGQSALVQREVSQLNSKLESIQWEQSELQKRQENIARRLDEASLRRVRAEEELESRQDLCGQLEADLESAAKNEADAMELLNELRTALAVEQRAEQSIQEQRAPMASRVRELEDSINRRKREIESYHERIANANEESARLTSEIASANVEANELADVLESRQGERQEKSADIATRDGALTDERRQISRIADQRGSEEVKTAQLSLRMESISTYVLERYRINLDAFEQDIHALVTTIQTQKSARSRNEKRRATMASRDLSTADDAPESETEPVMVRAGEEPADEEPREEEAAFHDPLHEDGPDWEFVELACTELKQRLDSMGPVNLEAIQEYEELEERHNFLQRECDDLASSKVELLEIIQRINIETKKRFRETFDKVRENFRTTFRELFGQGAQSDLVLINEDDPLDSGIDIIAKPPGKKLQNISLLSGGERSMTAVALLFSIYMVKPSPFCILDELDAPLDESNIGRFLKMLDKFIEKSQFVIVTHNKRTMRRADIIYGVTMEEFGVSKPVGMKLSESVNSVSRDYAPPTPEGGGEESAVDEPSAEPVEAAISEVES